MTLFTNNDVTLSRSEMFSDFNSAIFGFYSLLASSLEVQLATGRLWNDGGKKKGPETQEEKHREAVAGAIKCSSRLCPFLRVSTYLNYFVVIPLRHYPRRITGRMLCGGV